jgi:hypothetical protein
MKSMKTVALIVVALIAVTSVEGYQMLHKKKELQQRAKRFLAMPIPEGMDYVPDSVAERFIVEYAEAGKVTLDPELRELLQIVVMESSVVEDAQPGSQEAFMNESAFVLREILNEASR